MVLSSITAVEHVEPGGFEAISRWSRPPTVDDATGGLVLKHVHPGVPANGSSEDWPGGKSPCPKRVDLWVESGIEHHVKFLDFGLGLRPLTGSILLSVSFRGIAATGVAAQPPANGLHPGGMPSE